MASVRKRTWTTPKGEQKTAWLVDYADSSGKRRAKQFTRKKDADAWLIQSGWEVSQGLHTPDRASATVEQAVELWLAAKKTAGVEGSTLSSYEPIARLHIIPLLGAEKLNRLTKPRIEQFKDQLVAARTMPQAIRGLSHLRMIIAEAERVGLVAQNVALGVRLIKSSRHAAEIVIPTPDEIRKLLAVATPAERPMLMMVVMTGIRASELRGMQWDQVDLKGRVLHITRRADENNKLGSPKSKAGRRKIPLAPSLVSELREWRLRCPPNLQDLVFASSKGAIWSYSNLMNRVWWPLLVRAGVSAPLVNPADGLPEWDEETGAELVEAKYSLHAFRHAAASLWINQGIDLMRLKAWMGHAHVQTTLDTYGHLMHDHVADGALIARAEAALLG